MSGNDDVRGLIAEAQNYKGDNGTARWPSLILELADALEASLAPEPAGDERLAKMYSLSDDAAEAKFGVRPNGTDPATRSHPAPAATVEEVAAAVTERMEEHRKDDDAWSYREYGYAIATALTTQFDIRKPGTSTGSDEITALRAELDRVRLALTEAQRR